MLDRKNNNGQETSHVVVANVQSIYSSERKLNHICNGITAVVTEEML